MNFDFFDICMGLSMVILFGVAIFSKSASAKKKRARQSMNDAKNDIKRRRVKTERRPVKTERRPVKTERRRVKKTRREKYRRK